MQLEEKYDVIVVGGGHAGCEAAHASAVLGSKVMLISQNLETIARMSCNPAMGGVAKGQIIREIDALGGMTGIITDKSAIQFRMLNKSKGPAMWSPRAQCDRKIFEREWRITLEKNKNIDFWQDTVDNLIINNEEVGGVITKMGIKINSKSVILCNGTFLNGIIHLGKKNYKGGRSGEPAAEGITKQLIELKFKRGRMKTGTPPRLDGRTINYSLTEKQEGDKELINFSYLSEKKLEKQLPCHITYTSPEVHNILKEGFKDSPMFNGRIKGIGPRYCPSIEDKIERFSNKNRHQLFIEPEGKDTIEIYLNGFSTSLPEVTQLQALRKIKGLENVKMFRAGYAIEYDYFPPTQLKHTLETKIIKNLFFCGQINGTTGYEEAAAQGLVAGVNAARKAQKLIPIILKRSESYIGILIDDLITLGVDEPYRMFTSRAEHRLLLRDDNADFRLTEKGFEIGLVTKNRYEQFLRKKESFNELMSYYQETKIAPTKKNVKIFEKIGLEQLKKQYSLKDLLKRQNVSFENLKEIDTSIKTPSDPIIENLIENEIKYEGYINRQLDDVQKITKLQETIIPDELEIAEISGLSNELKQKLKKVKPSTIGQASRISGITPAALNILLIHIKKNDITKNLS